MADDWDQFAEVSTDDALNSLTQQGIVVTSGFRTEDDVKRLKAEGYTPASSGGHLNGDGVDLVPGKSGMTLEQLAEEARQRFGPKAIVGIHNGSHVDVKVPGWGNAPDVYRKDPWAAFDVVEKAKPDTRKSTDYSQMVGDRTETVAAAPGSNVRSVEDKDASTKLDSLIRSGASYGDALAQIHADFPEYPAFSPQTYAEAQAYHAKHPDYQGSFGQAMKTVPLSEEEKANNDFVQSPVGVFAGKTINAALAGAPVAAAGDEGNYWEAVAETEHPYISTAADVVGNVAGAVVGGKAVGAGARALAEGEGVLAPLAAQVVAHPGITQSAVDVGMGAGYGAAEAGPGHRLEGAAFGAGTTLALEGAGRAAIKATGIGRQASNIAEDATGAPLERDMASEAVTQPEASPAFDRDANLRNWLGKSHVVDATGRPLVVYHGSPDARFLQEGGTFKGSAARFGMGDEPGVHWFAKDREVANTYADDRRAFDYQNAEPAVVPAYLKMENPLIVDAAGETWRKAQARGATKDVIDAAKEAGHDGVIIRNVRDNYNNWEGNTAGKLTDTFAVFDSRQIKHVENHGAFDPNNPDIFDTPTSAAMRAEDGPSVASRPIDRLNVMPEPGTPEQRALAAQVEPEQVTRQSLGDIAKAGNINLARIDKPEDIDALMKFTTDSFDEFKLERRGVQSWSATEALAKDLGMTPDELLGRQTGEAFNAEQSLAARNLLHASADETRKLAETAINGTEADKSAFVKSFLLHAAITEKASGAAAEAGRALNIYRKVAKASLGDREAMQAAVKRLQDGVSVDDVAALVNSLKDDPAALNKFARDAIKPAFKDKLMFVWINSLLSGPKTHIVNMTSNLVSALMETPENAVAAYIGGLRTKVKTTAKGLVVRPATDRLLFSEIGPRLYGTLRGAGDALAAAKKGWGEEAGGKIDAVRPAIGGTAGKIIGLPTKLLNVEDEMFKAMARRSEMAGMAVRKARMEGMKGPELKARIDELLTNPTDEMKQAAADAALYKTFQRPLGPTMQKVSSAIQSAPILRLFVPFIRTPTNLLKYAVERSPAAPLLKEVRQDFIAGGVKRDLAIARMTVGTGIAALVAGLAEKGHITGNGPADPSARKALEADGWQPYSFKVGNEYISYRRLDPWATTIGTAADAVELQSAMTEKQERDAGAIITGAIVHNLASKTWLSGLSDLVDSITDPQANLKNTITRLGASIATPTIASQVTQMIDPAIRDTTDPSYMGQLRKKIEVRLPGLSTNVIARRDILGKEVKNEGGALARLLSPFDTRQVRRDPVAKAIYDSGARFSVPSREVGGGRLSDKDFDNYQQIAAQKFYDAMKETLADPEWLTMSRDEQRKAIEKAKNNSRKEARGELFGMEH